MWLIDRIAESRIQEAMEQGDFDDLAGRGQPLVLDDDRLIPEELRAVYRALKNAGYLPPELELQKEIADVEALLEQVEDTEFHARARKRLNILASRLSQARGTKANLQVEQAYYRQLLARLDSTDPD